MYKNYSKEPKQKNKLTESISKRNYSASIISKINNPNRFKSSIPTNNKNLNPSNRTENLERSIKSGINLNANFSNNLEKFIFLNQKFIEKENDQRKKIYSLNRKITSAEPNVLKTKMNNQLKNYLSNNDQEILMKKTLTSRFNPNDKVIVNNNFINIKKFNYVFMNNNDSKHNTINQPLISKLQNLKKNDAQNQYNSNSGLNLFAIPSLNENHNLSKIQLKNKILSPSNIKPFNEYFVQLIQNARETMEDFHLIEEKFNSKNSQSLFALFDGHGGVDVASKLKADLSHIFNKVLNGSKEIKNDNSFIENAIKQTFRKLDEDILKLYTPEMKFETTKFVSLGSTCTMLYLIKEKEYSLYCANIGDSRGVLISKSGATRITYEHKPSDESENKRVKDSGGVIFGGRIFGQFSLTRAFGDAALKKWVISDPFIKKVNITDNDKYAIIASDGIWDVISEQDCFEMSLEFDSAKSLCEELINVAVNRWSKDNISCIVVKLN